MKQHPPSLRKIRAFYEGGHSVPLILARSASPTPWELYQRVYPRSPHSFFFDSLFYRPPTQRYSYLGWRPFLRVLFEDHTLRVTGEFHRTQVVRDLHRELRKLFQRVRTPPGYSWDCFTGGAVGYWSYELAQEFDRISLGIKKGPSIPELGLLFFRDMMAFDHKRERYYLISWLIPQREISFAQALKQAELNIAEMEAVLSAPRPPSPNGRFGILHFRPEISKRDFENMVRRAKAYIRAGDIYQANLSQRFSFTHEGSGLRLYDRLRRTNPSPFSAVLHWEDQFIASSSPELLIAKKGNRCITRPIAGTRPRGRSPAETRRLARDLITNEKERAEHLMLVDLERNDLGRVSEWRSVRVKDFMRLEKYSRVIHIVSEISGQLQSSKDGWDLIQAMFPGGTITGCPKIRSMEIIDELEPVKRGIYTGSLGYVGFDGDLMLNIAIRTLVLLGKRGYLQVGAGIVADSDPTREYEETLHKGEALAEALNEASTT